MIDVFLKRHPEFNSLDRELIEEVLKEAELHCPAQRWGNKYAAAIQYRTAHILACRWIQVAAIAAIAVGGSAPGATPSEQHLSTTSYGREFETMRRNLVDTRGGFSF